MLETEKKYLLAAYARNTLKLENEFSVKIIRMAKSIPGSDKERKEGNELYFKNRHFDTIHMQILHFYNKSIALAPVESESQAMGYGNRSALLLHIGKYEDSIKDIDRALNITTCLNFKIKLLCRKVECLKALGSTEFEKILGIAKSCFAKVDNEDKDKEKLMKMIDKVEACQVNKTKKTNLSKCNSKDATKESLSKKELSKIPDSLTINYNQKYGRHLLANKDFEPGEVIFVEKLYANMLFSEKMYTHCNWCLKTCWSGIPCDNCGLVMFCSEECKNAAFENFHDIECSLYPHRIIMLDDTMHHFMICIRIIIVAIKEFGSVKKLRSELQAIDDCSDNINKGFVNGEKFQSDSIRSIYSLEAGNVTEPTFELFALKAIHFLICVENRTILLGKNFKATKVQDFMFSEDSVFLGSLFIRLCVIQSKNARFIISNRSYCSQLPKHDEFDVNACCDYGQCIPSFASLINHSCHPNVSACYTPDKKIVIYAVQPIKKKSQIFDNYYLEFYKSSKAERIKGLQRFYFTCDCLACTCNWPKSPKIMTIKNALPNLDINLLEDFNNILIAQQKMAAPDLKMIKRISTIIVKALKKLKAPDETLNTMNEALMIAVSNFYGLQSQFYGECDKS